MDAHIELSRGLEGLLKSSGLRSKYEDIVTGLERMLTANDPGLADEEFDHGCRLLTDLKIWNIDTQSDEHDYLSLLEHDNSMTTLTESLNVMFEGLSAATVNLAVTERDHFDFAGPRTFLEKLCAFTDVLCDYRECVDRGYLPIQIAEISENARKAQENSNDADARTPQFRASTARSEETALELITSDQHKQPASPAVSHVSSIFSEDSSSTSRKTRSLYEEGFAGDPATQSISVTDPESSFTETVANKSTPVAPEQSGVATAKEKVTLSPADEEIVSRVVHSGDAYACLIAGCNTSFTRAADLQRHYTAVHRQPTSGLIGCPYKWCGRTGDRGFTRQDHYRDHLREVHQLDIPRRSE